VTTPPVKIIECPRDAWQAMPQQIPPQVKADYLRALATAGFTHIDAVSFVSPAAVPQMADSEQVLALLDLDPAVEIIAIVVNEQGAERAVRTGVVRTQGFTYSKYPTIIYRKQIQKLQNAPQTLKNIFDHA
jgi:hydroxymethylglutaryl-CoA lyase